MIWVQADAILQVLALASSPCERAQRATQRGELFHASIVVTTTYQWEVYFPLSRAALLKALLLTSALLLQTPGRLQAALTYMAC